jgi:hypothetical protein
MQNRQFNDRQTLDLYRSFSYIWLSLNQNEMKKLSTGIIFFMIPLFIFAQTKDVQDPAQVTQKVNRLEKETQQLKKQSADMQRSIIKISDAMAKEQSTFRTFDSVVQANRDTVSFYGSKIKEVQVGQLQTAYDVYIRSLIFLVFFAAVLILLIFLQWTHRKQHMREVEELLGKLKSQRDEREKRIEEVITLIKRNQEAFVAFQSETEGNFVKERSEMFRQEEKLKQLVTEKTDQSEKYFFERIALIVEENTKLMNQTGEKFAGIDQKLAESSKFREELIDNYTNQFNTLRKDTAELINLLTREVKEIKEEQDLKKKKPA